MTKLLPDIGMFSDPKSVIVTTLKRLADSMFMLAESNNRLAEAIERNGLPK